MVFGDVAKSAMEKAVEAYKAVVQLQAIIEQLQRSAERFEERQERSLTILETRVCARVQELESRLRSLETEVSSLHGKIDGALAQALGNLLRERVDPPVAQNQRRSKATAALPDGLSKMEHIIDPGNGRQKGTR